MFDESRAEPKKSSAIIRTVDRQRESITLNTPLQYEIQLTSAHVLTVKARKPGTQTWKVLADSASKAQASTPPATPRPATSRLGAEASLVV